MLGQAETERRSYVLLLCGSGGRQALTARVELRGGWNVVSPPSDIDAANRQISRFAVKAGLESGRLTSDLRSKKTDVRVCLCQSDWIKLMTLRGWSKTRAKSTAKLARVRADIQADTSAILIRLGLTLRLHVMGGPGSGYPRAVDGTTGGRCTEKMVCSSLAITWRGMNVLPAKIRIV